MKSGLAMVVALSLVFAVSVACQREDGARAAEETRENQYDLMTQQRDQYVISVEAKFNEMESKIDGLRERARGMEGVARTNFEYQIEQLRNQKEVAEAKLRDLQNVSVESWATLKTGVDAELAELERMYQTISAENEVVR
jgi:TolA-binding protein